MERSKDAVLYGICHEWRGWVLSEHLAKGVGRGRPGPGWSAWLALPLLGWIVWRRELFLGKVLAFTVPMSLVPLFIYSGGGTTYYALFPAVSAAIVASRLLTRIAR